MFETIFIQQVVPVIAVAIAGLFVKLFGSWLKEQKAQAAKKEAVEALEAGIAHTAQEFVEAAKEAAKDGKLTKAEIEEARNRAFTRALKVATSPAAVGILLDWSWDAVTGVIDALVGKKKTK